LLTFGLVALRSRPHVIGGFHLLVNALAASVLARIVRARSLYFCVGGPLELLDGGVWAENRLFGLMETPDAVVERELIRSAATFDAVVTMGRSTVRFFHEHGVQTQFHIVPGAIDPQEFCPSEEPAVTDLILIGRLAEIKRIDVFLQAVALASTKLPGLTATIVGDGELRASLEQIARTSGLDGRVRFAGPQARVSDWLRGARVFVLTSDSEGLALSMMEAMMTGLPVIVSNVGDLGDLVEDGVNGYLVPRRHAEKFAARIVEVLSNPARRASLSTAARETALQCALAPISCKWNRILTEWMGK
jgi:glycosyltransferase involved in cell wall biosynthesis